MPRTKNTPRIPDEAIPLVQGLGYCYKGKPLDHVGQKLAAAVIFLKSENSNLKQTIKKLDAQLKKVNHASAQFTNTLHSCWIDAAQLTNSAVYFSPRS